MNAHMKKLNIILIAFFATTSLNAQKSAIQTAYNYLRYDDLDKAKEAIDQAAENPTSNTMAKTWFYRGQIYHAIYESTKEQFKSLKPGSLEQAFRSYEKTKELDTKNEYKEDLEKRYPILTSQFLNSGVDYFQAKEYSEALDCFEKSLTISSKYSKNVDSLAILNAAIAAEKSNNNEKALKYYNNLIGINYGGAKTYLMLASFQLNTKDTTASLTTLKAGRQKFPSNIDLSNAEWKLTLSSGKEAEASVQIDQAIINDPKNPDLYYAKGVLNDKLGKPDIARMAYLKAIEIKPDHFDANYNLGAMLFNEAAELVNKANDLPASKQKEFDEYKKKYQAKFIESKPYFEKAYMLNPKDMATLQNLRQVYTRLNELDKSAEIKKVIESLK